MPSPGFVPTLVRFFYRHFYNRFAFTYDSISKIVSRGEWRTWTGAAIPLVRGPRVLEVAFGTGNLLVDLARRGFAPVGVDLSPYMIGIASSKLKRLGLPVPILRARVQALPFSSGSFNTIVMTFPPGFVTDPTAMVELRRVLGPGGKLLWVDAPYLYPRDPWSRALNWAYRLTGGSSDEKHDGNSSPASGHGQAEQARLAIEQLLPREGWNWEIRRAEGRAGYVHLIVGTREGGSK